MKKRKKEFQRNELLEDFLGEINNDLISTEQQLLKKEYEEQPVVLIMGALRSGTTLTMQWLANTGQFAYPTNVMSRFYRAPIIGAKIQRLLLDPTFNFRNEITDFSQEISYYSQNGKTRGALSPNEFWYFWRRFFVYESLDMDYISDFELAQKFDKEIFVKELMGVANVFNKPLVMKGMIANYNIRFLNEILNKVVFIYVKREPCTNIASILEARERQLGDNKSWYSFRIPEMKQLMKLDDPVMQAAGQRYYINRAIEVALQNVGQERKMEIQYEEFCKNPENYYHLLRQKLEMQGCCISDEYCGKSKFEITRKEKDSQILLKYLKFMKSI